MSIIKIFLITLAALYLLVYIIFLICTRKPLKTLAFNAVVGWILLAIINLLSWALNIHIPVNYCSVALSGSLGAVGVALLILLQYIIV